MKMRNGIGVVATFAMAFGPGVAGATIVQPLVEARCGENVDYFFWRSFTVVGQFDSSQILAGVPRDGTYLHRNGLQQDPQTFCRLGVQGQWGISVRYADEDQEHASDETQERGSNLVFLVNGEKLFDLDEVWKDRDTEHLITVMGSTGRFCVAKYTLKLGHDEASPPSNQEMSCRAFRLPTTESVAQ